MKIFMRKKIWLWSVLCICFSMMMFLAVGCTKEPDKEEQAKEEQNPVIQEEAKIEGKTCFASYNQSISLKDGYFTYLFFCDKTDKERWDRLNVQSIYRKVADYRQRMIINAILIEDELVYGNYYRGILALEGRPGSVCSGEMSLLVKMADSKVIREFHLGKCSVEKSSGTDQKDILQAYSSAVAKPDKDGNIATYGNIVHIKTKKDIKIQNIDIALEDVGLDTKHYKIYSPKEYKAVAGRITVEPCDEYMVSSLEENDPEGIDILDEDIKEDETKTKSVKGPSMDKIYKKAYKKKVVDSLDPSINLKLKRGEYYVYFPFLFTDKDVPSVTSAVLRISYKADGKK